jgi:hypothetical protein
MFSLKNPAIKFVMLIAFFIFFYMVIYNICIFFGVDEIELLMYMGWLALLLILITFLPYEYSIFKIKPKPVAVVNPVPVPVPGGGGDGGGGTGGP